MIFSKRIRRLLPFFTFALGFFVHFLFHQDAAKRVVAPTVGIPAERTSQFLVILVMSSVDNYERRVTIRETWANELDSDARIFFVLSGGFLTSKQSTRLIKEEKEFQDLLILKGIKDSFQTLTLKVLTAMTWVTGELQTATNSTHIRQRPFDEFDFVLKCDDDSFVRVEPILLELRSRFYENNKLYWGFFDGRAKVKRTGKYKELGWNICDNYLPYALGGGYVLASAPVLFIARNAKYWRLYQNEDTSIGAWLSSYEGLIREHDPRFDTEYLSRGCHQSYLVTHKHTTEDMRKIHNQLIVNGALCLKEYRTRLSYKYNWDTVPSQCCIRNNPAIP